MQTLPISDAPVLRPGADVGAGAGAAVRILAHVWLSAAELGERDGDARVWLHLDDGQVRAFRLPASSLGDHAVLAPLARVAAGDPRGLLLEVEGLAVRFAIPLYAAPAVPLPMPGRWGLAHAAVMLFAAGLDQDVLHLLAQLESHRTWGSARNYTRLALLAPALRLRRLQALTRFPLLVAPVLLSAHHRLELSGGKRHAWRAHDDAVIEAIDEGRDLTGALAACYGISRALVRSAVCRTMWGSTALSHRDFLLLLDALAPEQRPTCWAEIEAFVPCLPALQGLVDEPARLVALGRALFRPGWTALWRACAQRFAPLPAALADAGDFLRAASAHAGEAPGGPWTSARLAQAWLRARGLVSLLQASRCWHAAYRAPVVQAGADEVLPQVLAPLDTADGSARELDDRPGLVLEGEEMGHCVADYWSDCLLHAHRIVRLGRLDGERATAQFRPQRVEADRAPGGAMDPDAALYRLVQLRGPDNADPSDAMQAWAHQVEATLNAPQLAPARGAALAAAHARSRQYDPPATPAGFAPLDRESALELARVLARHAARPENRPLPGEVLRALVAGFAWHGGEAVQMRLTPGCPLVLVREPNHPHDPLAVRIDGCGVTLGYVPRAVNAGVAQRLDAGQALGCQVLQCDLQAEPWARLLFAVTLAPGGIHRAAQPQARPEINPDLIA